MNGAEVQSFEYRHIVTLEETNALGNVYFSHYLRWQGQCRESFIHQYAPDVLSELGERYGLVTTRASCEYLAELTAFDEVLIRMRAGDQKQNRLTLIFDYFRADEPGEELVAHGEQQLAWLEREGSRFRPRQVPDSLLTAIEHYMGATPASLRG